MKFEKLAAIDVGTNSFHLIIVNVKDDGNFEIVDREKEVIRLSEGSAGDIKIIRYDAMERAVAALRRFKGIADSHGAKIRAVATSAVREAHNRLEFLNRVFDETGIEIEIISGNEEARLIYLGVLKAVPVYGNSALVIDIGGGSTEFLLGREGNSDYSISLKIGAVRLTQKFFPDFEITQKRIDECRHWVEGEIFHVAEMVQKSGYEICIGSSGTIMSAGLMINALKKGEEPSGNILNNFEFTRDELKKIEVEVLSHRTLGRRKKIPGLDVKRADIIPAGIIILSTIFDQFRLEKMTISGYALREGIIIDTLQKAQNIERKPNLTDIRYESVRHLSESCNYDREHCRHVAALASRLFDQLTEIHQLPAEDKEYLEAAALLHDIGYHIAHNNHHHHSYYIIRNSELLGFNEAEIDIIAHVARYHRKSHPKDSHREFSELPERVQNVIRRLASILRIADAFDRTHSRVIEEINVKIQGDRVILDLGNSGAPRDIELWNFERRKGLFEELFGKKILIRS